MLTWTVTQSRTHRKSPVSQKVSCFVLTLPQLVGHSLNWLGFGALIVQCCKCPHLLARYHWQHSSQTSTMTAFLATGSSSDCSVRLGRASPPHILTPTPLIIGSIRPPCPRSGSNSDNDAPDVVVHGHELGQAGLTCVLPLVGDDGPDD